MRVVFFGSALRGDGYPNAWNLLRILKRSHRFEALDSCVWFPTDFHLWKLSGLGLAGFLTRLSRMLVSEVLSLLRLCFRFRRGDVLVVPYPYLATLLLLSLLPSRIRPTVVVDVYNSLWGSLVEDRSLRNPASLTARILFRLERRALRAAHVLVVDTAANKRWVSERFQIEDSVVHTSPLAMPESWYSQEKKHKTSRDLSIRVVFFGTMIPLHGLDVVCDAVRRIERGVSFVFVGRGQDEQLVRSLERKCSNVTWIRQWLTADELKIVLLQSDVALGVFGGQGKAGRVFPWKVYIAMASALPVVTQSFLSLPEGCPSPPLTYANSGKELADRLLEFRDDPAKRQVVARQQSAFFTSWLSEAAVHTHWSAAIEAALASRGRL